MRQRKKTLISKPRVRSRKKKTTSSSDLQSIANGYKNFVNEPDEYYYLHFPPANAEDINGIWKWAAENNIPLERSNVQPSGGRSFRIHKDNVGLLPYKKANMWNKLPFGLPSYHFYGDKAGQMRKENAWNLSNVNTLSCLTKEWTKVKFIRRRIKPAFKKKRRVR